MPPLPVLPWYAWFGVAVAAIIGLAFLFVLLDSLMQVVA